MQTMNPHRKAITNYYCSRCGVTTKHTISLEHATCSRCGAEKSVVKNKPTSFEDRLDVALGLNEDSPKKPTLDGDKRKTADGAHLPNGGNEYTQMATDDKFEHKQNFDTIKP